MLKNIFLPSLALVAAMSFVSAHDMPGATNMTDGTPTNYTNQEMMNSTLSTEVAPNATLAVAPNTPAAAAPPAMPPSTAAPAPTLGTLGPNGQCICPSPAASNGPTGTPEPSSTTSNSSVVPSNPSPMQSPQATTQGPSNSSNETSAAPSLNTGANTCLLAIAAAAGLHALAT